MFNWFRNAPARMDLTTRQLAQRYGLRGRSVLSIGGGEGDLEYALRQAGCQVRRWVNPDPADVPQLPAFDVLLASNYQPDEMRRGEIMQQRDTDTFRRMLQSHGGWEWPPWEEPFHPILMLLAERLPPAGTLIVQTTSCGLDAMKNRFYLQACDEQLAQHGLRLHEVYRFARTVGVMLYAIARGAPDWPLASPIQAFYGAAKGEKVEALRVLPSPADPAGPLGVQTP